MSGGRRVKIVDAVWERRNLGVTCAEITLESKDTEADLRSALTELRARYLVVRAPASRLDLTFCLPSIGFSFIEAIIHVTRRIDGLELSGVQKRLANAVTYAPMQESDLQDLWSEIRKGMYDSDRISLDPYFAKGQAGERYIGWIQDEVARGGDVYKLVFKNQSIGYFTMKDLGDGTYWPFLAGMYESHRSSGLGFNIVYQSIREVAARGGKLVSTYISTNNESAIRLHVNMAFRFEEVTYVFVKHNDQCA
jgi:hypothetical protein